MRWNGKIVGLIIGLLTGHPFGVLLGGIVGHLYDVGFFNRFLQKGISRNSQRIQHIFYDCTFSVMGYVAKADGRVSEHEIRAAEHIMQQMDLSPELKREAIRLFNLGKQPDFDLVAVIQRLRTACWPHPNLLQTFLEIQIQIANAEGQVTPGKREALRTICDELGIRGFIFDQFEQPGHTQSRPTAERHLAEAYQILNISQAASDAEMKKAYRRLISQNHPDKLMSQGLPPEMIKLANERTQKIKSAYETIKKVRGIA